MTIAAGLQAAFPCLAAHRAMGDGVWRQHAEWAFSWFLGLNPNLLEASPSTIQTLGGCRDGLHSAGANQNQGAESTIAYLLANLSLRLSPGRGQSPRTPQKQAAPDGGSYDGAS